MLRSTLAFAASVLLVLAPSAFGQEYGWLWTASATPSSASRQRRLRRPPLRPHPRLRPARQPPRGHVIDATATENLRRFNLDFRNFTASRV